VKRMRWLAVLVVAFSLGCGGGSAQTADDPDDGSGGEVTETGDPDDSGATGDPDETGETGEGPDSPAPPPDEGAFDIEE